LPPADAADYSFQPDDGWVETPVLVGALLTAARRAGASLHWPVAVERLHLEQGRVAGVVLAGRVEPAELVIDCGGPAAGELLAPLGLAVARRRSPGLQVITEPAPLALARIVHAPGLYLRPDGGGRILLGSTEIDAELGDLPPATAALDPVDPRCQELLGRGQAVLPWLAGARLVVARVGWRPMPADGLTAAGPLPDLPGYYLAFTHSGVTLGPLLGRLIASELATGQVPPLLAPFRPARLTSRP
jgi:glycine/D-amino acid oxidase-like deaminating enzyme